MRSLITLTLLTTIKIVDNSLSGKEHDLKPSAENNDISGEPSGDQSQQFCEDSNEQCKVRSM